MNSGKTVFAQLMDFLPHTNSIMTERKTKSDWAEFVRELATRYENAEKVTLVPDNLSTHEPGYPVLVQRARLSSRKRSGRLHLHRPRRTRAGP